MQTEREGDRASERRRVIIIFVGFEILLPQYRYRSSGEEDSEGIRHLFEDKGGRVIERVVQGM